MFSLKLVMCVIVCSTFVVLNVNGKDCNVSNIRVQPNFDFKRYASGTWYEIKWLAPKYEPPENLYQDYRHHYTYKDDGNVAIESAGRDPADIKKCFYNQGYLQKTNVKAKLIYSVSSKREPYWVLKTDYTSYALVYGCYNVSSDGGCNGARSWIWSRTKTLAQGTLEMVQGVINDTLCANLALYLNTEHHNPCPLEIDECTLGQHNCHVNATCTNTLGSFTCSCMKGYSGDGVECVVSGANTNDLSRRWLLFSIALLCLHKLQ